MLRTMLTALVMMLAPATFAMAQDSDAFRSPSNNIHCGYFTGDGPAVLRCDIRQVSNSQPRRPRDCDLEWGKAFEITSRSAKGARICHGDTVAGEGTRVLAYGETWQRGGFSCTSSESGMTCRNANGAGFELARAAQRVF